MTTTREMGIEEARKQLGDLVLDAQRDSTATRITRNGKPAAILTPDAPAMKVYIWQDVLTDYSSGMIVAVAADLESALATADEDRVREEMGRVTPTVIEIGPGTPAQSWHVWGGG